jgi:hypothetical protein
MAYNKVDQVVVEVAHERDPINTVYVYQQVVEVLQVDASDDAGPGPGPSPTGVTQPIIIVITT